MKKFPVLDEAQVAIVIADGATGHVLNLNLETYRNDSDDEMFSIFKNIGAAREFIKNQSILNNKLEFVLYDKHQNILEHIEAIHWK